MIVTYAVSLRGGNGESTITIPYIEKGLLSLVP